MIPFRCPHCQLETRVDPSYAGQTGPCAGCGRPVTIPLIEKNTEIAGTGGAMAGSLSRRDGRTLPFWLLAVLTLCFCSMAGWVIYQVGRPIWEQAHVVALEKQCRHNMQAILNAIHAYHAENGCYPPAYTVDERGARLHSWRVLILPYLGPEGAALYAYLDLSAPWDSPTNAAYHTMIPPQYQCPLAKPFAAGDTSYCVVSSPGCAFDGANRVTQHDVRDPRNATILVVESADSAVNWMEPIDLSLQDLMAGVQAQRQRTCSNHHPNEGCTVALANGSIAILTDAVAPDELQALATIAGNEATPAPPVVLGP